MPKLGKIVTEFGNYSLEGEYVFQKDIIQSMNNHISFRGKSIYFPRGILDAATNAGKMIMLAAFYKSLVGENRMLLLIHRQVVYNQLVKFFNELFDEVGEINAKKYDIKSITIAMVKTVHNRMRDSLNVKKDLAGFNVVAVDECHLAGSSTYSKVLQNVPAGMRMFVSGTPLDSYNIINKMVIIGLSGPILAKVSKRELMDKGISLSKIIHESEKPVLIAVYIIEHGEFILKHLSRLFPDLEIQFVHGTDFKRDEKIEAFKSGDIDVLISTVILKEGINIPNIRTLIYAGGGKSKVDIKQWMGRGERRDGVNDYVTLHDFYDFGKYISTHSKKRILAYRKETLKIIEHYSKEDLKKTQQIVWR
jgi:superfamily II DNA or RNA helicase